MPCQTNQLIIQMSFLRAFYESFITILPDKDTHFLHIQKHFVRIRMCPDICVIKNSRNTTILKVSLKYRNLFNTIKKY